MSQVEYAKGLEGIIAAESKICQILGEAGKLYLYGYSLDDLVKHCTYESVCYLLLHGDLPSTSELQPFVKHMRSNRTLNEGTLALLKQADSSLHPMAVLQSAVLHMGPTNSKSNASNSYSLLYLVTQFTSAIAALYRFRKKLPLVEPRDDLSHGANFLYMLHGEEPEEFEGMVMDKCFILHAEHGFNASTFTARVVASTLSTYASSMSAAIGALFGTLHGGANEQVIEMLEDIKTPDAVNEWVEHAFANKKKIVGFGHRLYKTKDPRANHMESYLDTFSKMKNDRHYYTMLKAIERKAQEYLGNKHIYANVDFFSGTVYHLMRIPPVFYTPIFAAARTVGWLAHIQEQFSNNRLFRPKSLYVGPKPRTIPQQ